MPVIYQDKITRADIQAHPERLYVFGDNFEERGLGGQAKDCRGEPNTIGIPTKRAPHMGPDAFLTDADYGKWWGRAKPKLDRIAAAIGAGREVVIPSAGIGTGLAQLEKRAPTIWLALLAALNQLAKDASSMADKP
jgi:hypothetical protein